MKIRINKDIVEFTPEHASEAAELEALWVKMGNCVGGNKALSPIGTYVPAENKTATFHIDGLSEQEAKDKGEEPPKPKSEDPDAAEFTDSKGRKHKGILKTTSTKWLALQCLMLIRKT